MFHTGALTIWLLAAAVPAFTVRNPLYLMLILGASWLVYAALGKTSPLGSSWGSLVKLGLFFFALAIPFNALSNHFGRVVLFRLPQGWPIVGGPITLESIVAGAVSGLALLTMLAVFAAFNASVDHYELLRSTPPFLFQAGVVISVAITFVPQMVTSAREIREAQRIRGHRFRGLRDLLPLILPLLATSLERAIQLAETMEARGFGAALEPASKRRSLAMQGATLAALLVLLAGLVVSAYFPGFRAVGWALAGLGLAGLVCVFVLQGRRVRRTRYRKSAWQGRDVVVAVTSLFALGAFVVFRLAAAPALAYSPYVTWLPPFSPWLGIALLLLATPALLTPTRRRSLPDAARGHIAENGQ